MDSDALKIIEAKQQVVLLRKKRNELQQQLHDRLMRREQAVQIQRQGARLLHRKMAIEQQITLLAELRESSRAEGETMQRANEQKRQGLLEANAYLRAARREQVESTLEPVTQAMLWHYSKQVRRPSALHSSAAAGGRGLLRRFRCSGRQYWPLGSTFCVRDLQTARVSNVRKALVHQLLQLFPIAQNAEGRHTIVSIPLDKDRFAGCGPARRRRAAASSLCVCVCCAGIGGPCASSALIVLCVSVAVCAS